MKQIAGLAAVLFAASVATGASAQMMEDVDTDGDGMASYEELTATYSDVTEDQFTEMDTNEDGGLDEEEMTAASESGQLPEEM